jgi:hypothetical protein
LRIIDVDEDGKEMTSLLESFGWIKAFDSIWSKFKTAFKSLRDSSTKINKCLDSRTMNRFRNVRRRFEDCFMSHPDLSEGPSGTAEWLRTWDSFDIY